MTSKVFSFVLILSLSFVLSFANGYNEKFASSSADSSAISRENFDFLKQIGEGAFGRVFLARKNGGTDSGTCYAIKQINKSATKAQHNLFLERDIPAKSDHPFLVKLFYSFQTNSHLYMGMELLQGGSLYQLICAKGRILNEHEAKFYAAELILAIEYMHTNDLIHRDLKPENVMLDANGHVKLTDFGLCKKLRTSNEISYTFCGTLFYTAPEMIHGRGYGKSVDWWAMGVMIYEFLHGKNPFDGPTDVRTSICYDPIPYTAKTSPAARDLVKSLLIKNPFARLGNRGATEIKNHIFFRSTNWREVQQCKLRPPIKPKGINSVDFKNVDRFLNMNTLMPFCRNINDNDNHIQGFSFVSPLFSKK